MDIWADKVHNILKDNDVIVYLLAKYVDDINLATSIIPTGEKRCKEGRKWRLWYCKTQREEDTSEGKTPEENTMVKILWVGNRLV